MPEPLASSSADRESTASVQGFDGGVRWDLLEILQGDPDAAWAALDQILVVLNEKIDAFLNEIIHHPDFQALESMWAGLALLLDGIGDAPLVKVEMLNISKDDLLDDFEEYIDLSDCGLFYHLYKTEYDQAGGEPYGSVLLQYEFSRHARDVHLLKLISRVAASCHCPAIANISPALFGVHSYQHLEQIRDFDLLFQDPEYTKWHAFRQSEDARYVALVMPRILARTPYTRYMFDTYRFQEHCHQESDYCWTHASYGFGVLLGRSFASHGWCVQIRGPRTGGLVGNVKGLPIGCRGLEIHRFPLEAAFSDRQEHELSNQGFIVLNYFKENQKICVFSAPTVQYYARGTQKAFSSDDRLAASLPYIYLVSRIAHYQKVIQRENVGTVKESNQLEGELRDWLKRLVTQMPDPNLEVRCRYPLRNGSVKVSEDEGSPGFFSVKLVLQPHLQLEGINAELTLISKLPRSKE